VPAHGVWPEPFRKTSSGRHGAANPKLKAVTPNARGDVARFSNTFVMFRERRKSVKLGIHHDLAAARGNEADSVDEEQALNAEQAIAGIRGRWKGCSQAEAASWRGLATLKEADKRRQAAA
jgi:hypothetical protein